MSRTNRFASTLLAALILSLTAHAGSLRFSGKSIDTSTLPSLTQKQLDARGKAVERITVVVQFSGPIKTGDISALERAGATVHQYLPDYAYLVTVPADALGKLQTVPGAVWTGLLPPDAKVSRVISAEIAKLDAKAAATPMSYIVLSVDARAAKELEGAGYRNLRTRRTPMGWYETRVVAPLSKSSDISQIDSVFRVETMPQYELHGERAIQTAAGNLNAGGTAPSGPGYEAWLDAHGLTGGAGMVVQVQDDGLDKGIATNLPGTAHVDILGRIGGIANATGDLLGDSRAGHGQINTGIIIGNAALGATDSAGFLRGLGVTPNASVYATKIFRNDGDFDIGATTFTELARLAQNAGARFSNNSWGASVDGEYTSDSAEFDALTRDSDPNEPGNQPMVYFFSAGNDGPANGTLGSPGTAKNVITVGATENSDADGKDGCNINAANSNNNRDLAAFSSRGPAIDGRFGISIVAVGTHVAGPASTVTGYDGTGICDQYWPIGQTDYARSSGTSHSCPIACGAGMLVHELFSTQLAPLGFPSAPSPALVRAILTNTATSIQGGGDGNGGTIGHIPNNKQGWGTVNLGTLMDMKHTLYTHDQEHVFTASGQTLEIALRAVDVSKPVKITLAWTDAPAAPGTAVNLVNDLDLEVVSDVTTIRGNVFTNGFSTIGGNADHTNNIEAVYIAGTSGEVITVRVKAFNIAADGVRNIGGALDQDFALFAWNATDQSEQGLVHVSPGLVSCDDTLTVSVSDSDLRGASVVDVVVTSSTGDVEVATLAETDIDSGLFTGEVVLSSETSPGAGIVSVANGAAVTVAYSDASDANGQPAEVSDAALVDCAPPVIFDVQIDDQYSTQATVSFSTDGPASSTVMFGQSCNATSQIRSGGDSVTQHSAVLTGLSPSTPYFFVVRATDMAGNQAFANDGGCFFFTTSERPDFFTEAFPTGDNDLHNQSLLFTPNGSTSFYSVCRTTAFIFPSNPTTGTVLNLTDDSFVEVALGDGKSFPFYGIDYTKLYIGSNGYIMFDEGNDEYSESLQGHFAQPGISALFDDLVPDSQHPLRYQQLADRAVVSWVNVPEFGVADANNVQVELYFDGRIQVTHLQIDSLDGVVGLSKGLGVPADFIQSDLNAYGSCDSSYTIAGVVTLPGGAALEGVTLDGLPGNPVTGANGAYSATVPGGFAGVVTPQLLGYSFSPVSRTYVNVAADLPAQDYAASQAALSVSPTQRDVGPGAEITEFSVQNVGAGLMNWTAEILGDATWLSLESGASGSGDGTVRIAVEANTIASERSATLRISAPGATGSPADVTILQGAAPALTVSPSARTVGAAAGVTSFVVANAGGGTFSWTAIVQTGGEWLNVTSGEDGLNSGVIGLSFAKNTGNQRTGTLRISAPGAVNPTVDVTVTQAAAPSIAVAPDSRELPSDAGTATFDLSVEGGSGIDWDATVLNGDWLVITTGASGTDGGQIEVAYESNPGADSRTASIRIIAPGARNAPVVVVVTQAAFVRLQVQSPNGGEKLRRGKKVSIRWKSQGSLEGPVRVELYRHGVLVEQIREGLTNDGKAPWRVPKEITRGGGYQVRISSETDATLSDFSDDTFRIR